ncbi:MAG: putative protein phosphatase 2C-type [Chlamydiae bacterium]|nr:putative protein phosphatase 2C-type [Chlamydiota bacterium]
MKIESYGVSDIGLSRLNNEDAFAQLPKENCFILADGMGGHNAGEVAANETVFELCRLVKDETPHTPAAWAKILNEGIKKANAHVFNLATKEKKLKGMGTTLCLALIAQTSLIYAHVGDSRIYRFRKGRLTQLTEDHSLKAELIAKGELDESDAAAFPKNVITRAIGTSKTVTPQIQTTSIESGDLYFLCSDGLTDPLNNTQILDIIEDSLTIEEASESLILAAKKRGGGDNITLLLFKIT